MPDVIVIGGGLAGLAATSALAGAGYRVRLFESKPFLGGRATSFPVTAADGSTETVDNCQHILLGCCVNLLDFYRRLGVSGQIRFHDRYYFIEPGGRVSHLGAASGFGLLRVPFLSLADKFGIARAVLSMRREHARTDLDDITMLDWLQQHHQTPHSIACFWRPVLVSALNEEPGCIAAAHGFQVLRLGFLAGRPQAASMGIPEVPLARLYGLDAWSRNPAVSIHTRARVERLVVEQDTVRGVETGDGLQQADYYVCALPFDRVAEVAPALHLDLACFTHSPITGIHLWFDRSVTDLPYAALLGRTIQWFFNKSGGCYLQLVVSASRHLIEMSRADIIGMALGELSEFLPQLSAARLEKAHVVKEVKATFSARPGLEAHRPAAATALRNLFLAGDWTRSGWPATMEGAVRSGYLAAEALTVAAGSPRKYVIPDLAGPRF
jgi:squalene-associated FAD-dependent desaturase